MRQRVNRKRDVDRAMRAGARGTERQRGLVMGEMMRRLTEARSVLDMGGEALRDWLNPVEWDNLRVLSSGMYRTTRMLDVLLARNAGRVLSDPIHIGTPCEAALAFAKAPGVDVVRAGEGEAVAGASVKGRGG